MFNAPTNPMTLAMMQGANPNMPTIAPSPAPQQSNMQSFMNNPYTTMAMGILGGNYGRDSRAAFANSMKGGLLGMQQSRVAQMQKQQMAMQQQAAQMKKLEFAQAQKEAEEKKERDEARRQLIAQQYPELAGLSPQLQDAVIESKLNLPGKIGFEEEKARISAKYRAPEKHQIIKGIDGRQYYASGPDRGKLVLSGLEAASVADVEGEGKLRKEFLKQTNEYAGLNDAWGRVEASVSEPSGAGDIALVFGFMKLLDPNSTVREGEAATVRDAGSVPSTVLAMYNKAINGESLAPQVRRDIRNRAAKLFNKGTAIYKKREGQYRKTAQAYKFDPERTIPSRNMYGQVEMVPSVAAPSPMGDSTQYGYDAEGNRYRLNADGTYGPAE